ncbi:hypothetical protein [Rhizobium sp. NLR22b]|uniref:hypothetical protein n=1 Tax=Rhizobium sp. NLR22b TaxID=2731115 RepID=UPI002180D4C4|nr:hypothetical protein [Rhizobium sp. NLR22b]
MSVVMNLALLFGALTLTCWMMGGAVAVLGTAEHPRHHLHQLSEFVSLGFNVFGYRMCDRDDCGRDRRLICIVML